MNRFALLLLFIPLTFCFGQTPSTMESWDRIEMDKVALEKLNAIIDSNKSDRNKYNYTGSFRIADQFNAKLSKLDKLRYPPVTNHEVLYNRINALKTNIDSFDIAYDKIQILSSTLKAHILIITFKYNDRIDTAFAYFKVGFGKSGKKVGIHIIPGSGINQSSAMFYNDKKNYQSNIVDLMRSYGDLFILVKPNDDFLAIHNGIKKISETSFVNYLLNSGTSYSAYYLIQSFAISKYIKTKYEELYVCGLSQGGLAALINSLQSHPDKAIIASGYSVIMDNPHMSGHDQIIIPNYKVLSNSKLVKQHIQNMNTQFLFTWGIQETSFHGIDAKEKLTLEYFKELINVKCRIHSRGHIYSEPAIIDFLGGNVIRPHRNF